MASQRHKREFNFDIRDYGGTQTGEPTGPRTPLDSAEETADQYDEVPSWPNGDRPGTVPP